MNKPYLALMGERDLLEYKIQLKEKCLSIIRDRMASLATAMDNAQHSANEETKSSVGDKYETSRAMGQLEKDMYARQLAETTKEMASLMSIDCNFLSDFVKPGSLVKCTTMSFFILAGLGKLSINGETVLVVSPNAPLAQSLIGKKTGDLVSFNKLPLLIEAII